MYIKKNYLLTRIQSAKHIVGNSVRQNDPISLNSVKIKREEEIAYILKEHVSTKTSHGVEDP